MNFGLFLLIFTPWNHESQFFLGFLTYHFDKLCERVYITLVSGPLRLQQAKIFKNPPNKSCFKRSFGYFVEFYPLEFIFWIFFLLWYSFNIY